MSLTAKKVTEGPKRVSASALEVWGIVADVRVDTHPDSDIEYTASGPADRVKAIGLNVRGDTLIIEGDGSDTLPPGLGGNVFEQKVVGEGENAVQITVKVPQGTPVNANRVLGNVVIGDIWVRSVG